MATGKYANVDEYANSLTDAARTKFAELRALMGRAAPGAREGISYGIAALQDDGYFVYFSGSKRHVSLYPAPTDVAEFEAAIAPYHSGKGTLRFPLDAPLPEELITRVVQYRREELRTRKRAKTRQ